jgi:hypothetical protein
MRKLTLFASLITAVTLATVSVWGQSGARSRTLPTFEIDRSWPKPVTKWKLGDASSFAIDAQDNVWLLHRPRQLKGDDLKIAAPPVVVFDGAGNLLKAWGGAGAGYEWPEREHIHVDPKGFVGSGNYARPMLSTLKPVSDDQLPEVHRRRQVRAEIGKSNQSKGNADRLNVHRAADIWLHPATNELFVADGYGNHRVAVFDPDTGAMKRMWGAFGETPVDDDHCSLAPLAPSDGDRGPKSFSITRCACRRTAWSTRPTAEQARAGVHDHGKFVKQLIGRQRFARDRPCRRTRSSSYCRQRATYRGGGPQGA